MKNYLISLLMLLSLNFDSYSMKRDRIESSADIQQSKIKSKRLKSDQNEEEEEEAIAIDIRTEVEEKEYGFLDLPTELQFYIVNMLLPNPKESALKIIAKSEDFIVFVHSCKSLKDLFENILTLHIKNDIDEYKSIKLHGDDLLALAVKMKNYTVASMLIKLGFPLNSLCFKCSQPQCQFIHFDSSVLAWAITNGHSDIVRQCRALIIENRIPFDFVNIRTDKLGRSVLHLAARNSDEVCVSMILAWGANVNALDKRGQSPLFYAIGKKNFAIVKFLMSYGADCNVQDNEGCFTPFLQAITFGCSEIVKYLIDKNANVNARNKYGLTPLLFAKLASNGTESRKEIIKILKDNGAEEADFESCDKYRTLTLATTCGWLESAKLLLETEPLIRDKNLQSPLHHAICYKRFKAAKFLIDQGFNIYEKDDKGYSLLLSAVCRQDVKACEFLLAHDVDHRLVNEPAINTLITPLMRACEVNNLEIAELLIKNGANMQCLDKNGCPALIYAIELRSTIVRDHKTVTKQIELMKFLLNNGANINCANGLFSPLMVAVKSKQAIIVKFLLDYGADVYYVNDKGQTARDIAEEMKDKEIIELLTPRNRWGKK